MKMYLWMLSNVLREHFLNNAPLSPSMRPPLSTSMKEKQSLTYNSPCTMAPIIFIAVKNPGFWSLMPNRWHL